MNAPRQVMIVSWISSLFVAVIKLYGRHEFSDFIKKRNGNTQSSIKIFRRPNQYIAALNDANIYSLKLGLIIAMEICNYDSRPSFAIKRAKLHAFTH